MDNGNVCCYNRTCAMVSVCLTAFLIFHNMTKVPYYLPMFGELPATNQTWDAQRCDDLPTDERWCFGLQLTENWGRWFGYRAAKLAGDPPRFFAVHATIGSASLFILIPVWLQKVSLREAAPLYMAVVGLLWLHAWNMLEIGVPARSVGEIAPPFTPTGFDNILNQFFVLYLLGVGVFVASRFIEDKVRSQRVLILSFVMTGANWAAAALEFSAVLRSVMGGFPVVEGNQPLWWSGDPVRDPYSQIGTQTWGTVATFTLIIATVVGGVLVCRREARDVDFSDEGQVELKNEVEL